MPTTYASDAERAANRQELYNMMANAQASPYYATSGGWYGNPMYNAPVYNNLPLAAHQASGAHYSAPGSREGWEEVGAPPVIYQRSPYATAAFRVTQNPWGGASVAPLVGFPSRYPHVLSGVPMQPGSLATAIMAPYIMRPQSAPARPAAPAKKAAAKTTTQTDTKKDQTQTQTQPATQNPQPQLQGVGWNAPIQTSHHRDVRTNPRPAPSQAFPEDAGMLTNPQVGSGRGTPDNMTALQLRQRGLDYDPMSGGLFSQDNGAQFMIRPPQNGQPLTAQQVAAALREQALRQQGYAETLRQQRGY